MKKTSDGLLRDFILYSNLINLLIVGDASNDYKLFLNTRDTFKELKVEDFNKLLIVIHYYPHIDDEDSIRALFENLKTLYFIDDEFDEY